ncbi:hypothetical protein DL98DRAFT_443384, partial [Cadophora sp. DSE1049]
LIGYFKYNTEYFNDTLYLYSEFPAYYRGLNRIGRIYYYSLVSGDRFYLQLLLTVVC